MSDPRNYQRTGAYASWSAMDRQDAEENPEISDEEYEDICTAWDAKTAEEEAASASLWPDFMDVTESAHAMEDSIEHPLR